MRKTPLASAEKLASRPLGDVRYDSLGPEEELHVPWLLGASLAAAFTLGKLGWDWPYLVALFWGLVYHECRRRRRVWAGLLHEAEQAAARASQCSSCGGSVSDGRAGSKWINAMLRAIWPVFERGMANYVREKIVKKMGDAGKISVGRVQLGEATVKSLSFGRTTDAEVRPAAGAAAAIHARGGTRRV